MKKTFLSLFLMLLVGGLFAQMPIILESDLQKLKEEATVKKTQTDKGFRNASSTDDSEQVDAQSQVQPAQTQAKKNDVVSELSKLGTNSQVTATEDKTNATSSKSVNRFRERQKKAKKK